MPCPFSNLTKTAVGPVDLSATRRQLMMWGLTLGAGGVVLPACGGADTGSDDQDSTEYDFLDQYDALIGILANASIPAEDRMKAFIGARGKLISEWLKARPDDLFAELRAKRPVLHAGLMPPGVVGDEAAVLPSSVPVPVLVAMHSDVTEVLDTQPRFTVLPYVEETEATLGHFTLADPDVVRHDLEKATHEKAFTSELVATFQSIIRQEAERLVDEAISTKGEIDVVRDLGRKLPVRITSKFLGVASGDEASALGFDVTDEQVYGWIAAMFWNFFLALGMSGDARETIRDTGRAAGAELMSYLTTLIEARRPELAQYTSADWPEDLDVLGRFIVLADEEPEVFSDDQRIAANLAGIVIGAVVTIEKSIANIVDVLLDEDRWGTDLPFGIAVDAAQADDMALMNHVGMEALRFRTQGIAIPRVATEATVVGGVTIQQGQLLLASHASAMMDDGLFPEAASFSADPSVRPADGYMHFGYARYECLGKELAQVEIAEALRALSLVPGLHKPAGSALTYATDNPYPESFVLAV